MGDLLKLDVPERPCPIALITQLEEAIDGAYGSGITPAEVLGALGFVSKQFYSEIFQ